MQGELEPPTEPSIEGSTVREFLLYYERRYGSDATVRLVEGLPSAVKARIDPTQPALGILGASWYPISVTHPMLNRATAGLPLEGRELAQQANRDIVPRMIKGMYKMLFEAVATPERYASHIGRLWQRLHTTGERSMVIRAPGEALSRIERWPGHHPFTCWLTIYTMVYVFEAMGYRRWTVERITCMGHGAKACETLLKYRK